MVVPVEPGFPEEERLRTCSLHRGRSKFRDLGQELSESWTGTYTIPERQMTGFRSMENLQMLETLYMLRVWNIAIQPLERRMRVKRIT